MAYEKPAVWSDPKNKLFPYQVGLTAPPNDFDAAQTDLVRIAPETVGINGRMLYRPDYGRSLAERQDNFHLLEEFAECMANNGADVCGQVGVNWSHTGGKSPDDVRTLCKGFEDKYQTPFHMAGLSMIEALRSLGAERIAVNAVYYWPDWHKGIIRFLREDGLAVEADGNFVGLGIYEDQAELDAQHFAFPEEVAFRSMERLASLAPDVDAYLITGVANFRRSDDGLAQRVLHLTPALEKLVGKPVVAADTALYWQIFDTLGVAAVGDHGQLLASLATTK